MQISLHPQRPLGNMLCYLPLESCTVAEEVEFREYRGRLPTQFYGEKRKATMYEVCTSKVHVYTVSSHNHEGKYNL